MKRYRVKAVGLGLALWAGYLDGADAPPAVLPASVRAGEWTPSAAEANTLWFPARGPVAAPAFDSHLRPASHAPIPSVVPAVVHAIPPSTIPPTPPANSYKVEVPAVPQSAADESILGPLPAIPTIPTDAAPLLPPRMLPIAAPPLLQPDPLPLPRTSPPAKVAPELPTAPPELMVPPGVPVPGKHGTFGSSPIRISKDYPSVSDLLDRGGGWWDRGAGEVADAAPSADRLDFRIEFLLWWMRPQQIPILATTSIDGGNGFLGEPGTRTLLGGGSLGNALRTGLRTGAGYWFDESGQCGVDGSFFFLGRQNTSNAFDSGTYPTIARPFFAPNFPAEFGEIVALRGDSRGVLTVDSDSTLWGFDANVRHALCKTCDFRSYAFAGYRFLALNESLTINEYVTALPGNPIDPPDTLVNVYDRFATTNRFNGGQIGYAAERTWSRVSFDGRASIALGDTHQTLDIAGSQTRLLPGATAPDRFIGGLLATGRNLGRFSRDRFSVVPEATVNLGFWVTPTIKVYMGYNFLYWSNVIRPGDQIDRVVDVSLVPNPPPNVPFSGQFRPQPTFNSSDLWVSGIQFGLMGRW